jgi:hypothetical protein
VPLPRRGCVRDQSYTTAAARSGRTHPSRPAIDRASTFAEPHPDGRPCNTRTRHPCRSAAGCRPAAAAHAHIASLDSASLLPRRVVRVRLDRRRRATEPIGELRDRQTFGLTAMVRQRGRAASLGHPVICRRTSTGDHASGYCERRGDPRCSPRSVTRRSVRNEYSLRRKPRGQRPLAPNAAREIAAAPAGLQACADPSDSPLSSKSLMSSSDAPRRNTSTETFSARSVSEM